MAKKLTYAYALVGFGMLLIIAAAASGTGGGGTTTTTTISCASGVQQCGTLTTTMFQVTVTAVSSSGTSLQAAITIDGTACGTGSCTLYLSAFTTHVAVFGPVAGYTTPSQISFYLPAPTTFNGVYFPLGVVTTTLTVTLTNYNMPVPNRAITAAGGGTTQTQYTNAQGQAVFTVNQNSVYVVGNMGLTPSVNVNIGTGPVTYTFAMSLNGPFSVLGGGSPSSGQMEEAVLGVMCVAVGAWLFAGRKRR